MTHTILRNKRKEANDFSMEYPCDFCKRFTSQVLEIPNTFIKFMPHESPFKTPKPLRICRKCLN